MVLAPSTVSRADSRADLRAVLVRARVRLVFHRMPMARVKPKLATEAPRKAALAGAMPCADTGGDGGGGALGSSCFRSHGMSSPPRRSLRGFAHSSARTSHTVWFSTCSACSGPSGFPTVRGSSSYSPWRFQNMLISAVSPAGDIL